MEESHLPPTNADAGMVSRGSMLRQWLVQNKKSFKELKEQQQLQRRPYAKTWSDVDEWSEYDSGLPDSPDSAALAQAKSIRGQDKRISRESTFRFPEIVDSSGRRTTGPSSGISRKCQSEPALGMIDRYSLSPRPLHKLAQRPGVSTSGGRHSMNHGSESSRRSRFAPQRNNAVPKLKQLMQNDWVRIRENEARASAMSKNQRHQSEGRGSGKANNGTYVSKALATLHQKRYLEESTNAFSLIKGVEETSSDEQEDEEGGEEVFAEEEHKSEEDSEVSASGEGF